jgi:hypothetical protein
MAPQPEVDANGLPLHLPPMDNVVVVQATIAHFNYNDEDGIYF